MFGNESQQLSNNLFEKFWKGRHLLLLGRLNVCRNPVELFGKQYYGFPFNVYDPSNRGIFL